MTATTREIVVVYATTVAIWLLFDRAAAWTGSLTGESGVVICAVVLAALLVVQQFVHRRAPRDALRALGFGVPRAGALVMAGIVSAAMIAVLPIAASLTATPLPFAPVGWRSCPASSLRRVSPKRGCFAATFSVTCV